MRTIRASEIGSFLYCQRAWWYQTQGLTSENQTELSAGSQLHRRHSRHVFLSGILRTLAVVLILVALALLAAYFTQRLLPPV